MLLEGRGTSFPTPLSIHRLWFQSILVSKWSWAKYEPGMNCLEFAAVLQGVGMWGCFQNTRASLDLWSAHLALGCLCTFSLADMCRGVKGNVLERSTVQSPAETLKGNDISLNWFWINCGLNTSGRWERGGERRLLLDLFLYVAENRPRKPNVMRHVKDREQEALEHRLIFTCNHISMTL